MSWIDLQPLPLRFTEARTRDGVEIHVPVPRNRFVILGTPIAVAVLAWAKWDDAECFLSGADQGSGNVVWLVFWIITLLGYCAYWLWTVNGCETFLIEPSVLTVQRRVLGLRWECTFPWDEICNLRFRPERGGVFDVAFHEPSALVFEHGGRTCAFARHLDGTEIDQMIARMQPHLPPHLSDADAMFQSLP